MHPPDRVPRLRRREWARCGPYTRRPTCQRLRTAAVAAVRCGRGFQVRKRTLGPTISFATGTHRRQDAAMHRLNGLKLRLAILPVLMVALNLAAPGEAFADPDGFADPAAGPLAAEAPAAGLVPYLSVGAGVIRSEGARFRDGRDSGNATLYGSGETFDAGAVESGLHARLAAGVRMPTGLRVQLGSRPRTFT